MEQNQQKWLNFIYLLTKKNPTDLFPGGTSVIPRLAVAGYCEANGRSAVELYDYAVNVIFRESKFGTVGGRANCIFH